MMTTPYRSKVASEKDRNPLTAKDLKLSRTKTKAERKIKEKAKAFMNNVINQRKINRQRIEADRFDVKTYWLQYVEPNLIRMIRDGDNRVRITSCLSKYKSNELILDKIISYGKSLGYYTFITYKSLDPNLLSIFSIMVDCRRFHQGRINIAKSMLLIIGLMSLIAGSVAACVGF